MFSLYGSIISCEVCWTKFYFHIEGLEDVLEEITDKRVPIVRKGHTWKAIVAYPRQEGLGYLLRGVSGEGVAFQPSGAAIQTGKDVFLSFTFG